MKKIMRNIMFLAALAFLCGLVAQAFASDAESGQVEVTVDQSGAPLSADEVRLMQENSPEPMAGPEMARGPRNRQRPGRWADQQNDMQAPMDERQRRQHMDGDMPGGRGPMGRGEWSDRSRGGMGDDADPERVEQLMEFLSEHEPSLAVVLKEFRKDNPEMFERRLPGLLRIYGPLMEQMKRNPELAEMGLKRIRLNLRVEQAQRQFNAAGEADKATAKAELRKRVAEQYDLIMQQTEVTVDRFEEQVGKAKEWREILTDGKGTGREHKGDQAEAERPEGREQQAKMQKHRAKRMEEFSRRLEEQRESLRHWRKNREQIIDQRVQQLTEGVKEFPWGH